MIFNPGDIMGLFSKKKAKETVAKTGEAIEGAGKKVVEGTKEIIDDMGTSLGEVGTQVADAGKKVVDGAAEIAGDVGDDLGDAADKVEEAGKKVIDKTKEALD